MTKYFVAEKFRSIQGEGVYTGTPMAFIRFVGCSVGKTICQHCDTDFDTSMPWRGGGEFTERELMHWARDYEHVCLTGGEPLDQDLEPLFEFGRHSSVTEDHKKVFHIETSGTKALPFWRGRRHWMCVSPKPGFLEEIVLAADEVKVIVPGLGEINEKVAKHWVLEADDIGESRALRQKELKRWPSLEDAKRWAAAGKIVFLQPRNGKFDVDKNNLLYVQDLIRDHPELRLSVQMHKILKVQ